MAIIASDILREVRDYHPAFDVRKLPDPMLLRAVQRSESRIVQGVLALNEESLAVTDVVYHPSLVAVRGARLRPHLLILSVSAQSASGADIPVPLIQRTNLENRVAPWPAGYVQGGSLFLYDSAWRGRGISKNEAGDGGWDGFDTLKVTLVPSPPRLTRPSQALMLPDIAHDALVAMTAQWAAGRLGVSRELPDLPGEALAAEQRVVGTLSDQNSTSMWTVNVVEPF